MSGSTAAKSSDNEVGSTGSRYSLTPFQNVKCMSSYSSIPHDLTDAYKASIFSRFVVSPPPVGNATFLFFSSPFTPCLYPPSFLPPQFWTVTYPHLSTGLGSDVGGLTSSSVPPCYY